MHTIKQPTLEEVLGLLNEKKTPKIAFNGEINITSFSVIGARFAFHSDEPDFMHHMYDEFFYEGDIEIINYSANESLWCKLFSEDNYRFASLDNRMFFDRTIISPWSIYQYNFTNSFHRLEGERRHPKKPFIRAQMKNYPEGEGLMFYGVKYYFMRLGMNFLVATTNS